MGQCPGPQRSDERSYEQPAIPTSEVYPHVPGQAYGRDLRGCGCTGCRNERQGLSNARKNTLRIVRSCDVAQALLPAGARLRPPEAPGIPKPLRNRTEPPLRKKSLDTDSHG